MKILKNRFLISYLILFLFLSCNEIIFRLISNLSISNFSFLRILVFINIISVVSGYLLSLTKKEINFLVIGIIILASSVYGWVELGFYNFLGVYISVNTSSQLEAVTSYIVDFFKSLKFKYYLLYLPFIIYTVVYIYLLFKGNKREKKKFKLKYSYSHEKLISFIIFALLSFGLSYFFNYSLDDKFLSDSYQVVSNRELFKTASNPGLCVKEFGINGFGIVDIRALLSGEEDNTITEVEYTQVDTTRQFDDSAWLTVIEEEKNSTYNKLNNYFINAKITDKNEMTGLFEGKNLIVLMLESVNDIINNPDYFPNFYKMASNGWYFENNYSPRNSCATGNNEFSAMTGLYSIYNSCTSNVYVKNTYYEAIFNLFNNAGYSTNSFHDYTESYYSRYIIHPNMGSGKYYNVKDLKMNYFPQYGGWASDVEFIEHFFKVMDESSYETPFMTYLTTVTSHQPYGNSYYGNLYYDMTKDSGYSSNIRHYMSKLKVLDEALGTLLAGLEQRGILDDTVIVMFGDHYPYGIPIKNLNEVLDRPLTDYENEKVPLVIYNTSLEAKVYDTYTSYLNLTPTLANLFNLDFDPRLYMGVDIFSSEYDNIVAFADGSWKNDLAYFDATKNKINYFTDFTYTDEEIKNINNIIYAKMNTSAVAIRNNYFNYLDKKIKAVQERETIE